MLFVNEAFSRPNSTVALQPKRKLYSRGEQMFLNDIEFANKWVVLCVDDEADGLFLRAQILERFGYVVIASTHPLLALDIVCNQTIDATLLDYHMPQMNGAELSAKIRKKVPNVKIIMLQGVLIFQHQTWLTLIRSCLKAKA